MHKLLPHILLLWKISTRELGPVFHRERQSISLSVNDNKLQPSSPSLSSVSVTIVSGKTTLYESPSLRDISSITFNAANRTCTSTDDKLISVSSIFDEKIR